MTNEVKPNGQYKQIYYRNNRLAPYTSSTVSEDDYLQTDVWRELRNERLRLDNFQCKHCGTGCNLVVHHIRYPTVWGMENVVNDLLTLCDKCHTKVHENDINRRAT